MYRILLFNDSKWRDLPGTALLKIKLHKLLPDAIIEVASFHLWEDALEYFRPHLVVLNHVQGRRNKIIADYVKRHGGLVVIQFNEGIIEFDARATLFELQRGHQHVDLFLCWGDTVSGLVDGTTTGCPRFDIYQKPYNNLIDTKALFCNKHGLDPNKQIVLFGDSWPGAKFAYSLQEFHKDNWSDLSNVLAEQWADADAFAQQCYERQELFKFTVKHVAMELQPKAQVIVASHPMSDFVRWQRWGVANSICVIDREYIFNTLTAADVYIGKLGSNSIAEAWMLGVPVISLGMDYDSASSLEQHEILANIDSGRNIDWEKDYVRVVDIVRDILHSSEGEDDITQYEGISMYLDKWGFNFNNASGASAQEIVNLLKQNNPSVERGNYSRFSMASAEHDKIYQNKLDSYGNWDKAVTQADVTDWINRAILYTN